VPVVIETPAGNAVSRDSVLGRNRWPIVLGLVNNMPDAAFIETENQFVNLLQVGAAQLDVRLRLYSMPSIDRNDAISQRIATKYFPMELLYAEAPDGLVVTGTEPHFSNLRDELYWADLEHLLRWTEANVPMAVLSCLASHAALLALDGIPRTPLPAKCSGVFQQVVDQDNPLTRGIAPAAFPHSRLNGVADEALVDNGYDIVVSSESGWTVAVRDSGRCSFVLFQGHPEYSPTTLLREYRRDARRYLEGSRTTFPALPTGYLDDVGTLLLEDFAVRATEDGANDRLMEEFPYEAVGEHIAVDWRRPSTQLFTNWLAEVGRRNNIDVMAALGRDQEL
jgi:homoserine O-succinyltransferase